jgi:hypothetical protein
MGRGTQKIPGVLKQWKRFANYSFVRTGEKRVLQLPSRGVDEDWPGSRPHFELQSAAADEEALRCY